MKKLSEPEEFHHRLKLAWDNAGYGRLSISGLARSFNAQYEGHAVSVHAVRRWVVGEAIPTQDKILTLSKWLGVEPAWLRFGDANLKPALNPVREKGDPNQRKMVDDYNKLSDEHKELVHGVIALLKRLK